jgi:hypothetical protein
MSRRFLVYLGGTYQVEEAAGNAELNGRYQLVDWLEPVFASVASNEIGELRCIASRYLEDARAAVKYHSAIQVVDSSNNQTVFDGVVVKGHMVINANEDAFNLVAYNNADYLLHRIALHGQARRDFTTEGNYFNAGFNSGAQGISFLSDLIVIDTPLVFNPDGLANMTQQSYFNSDAADGNTVYLFEAPGRDQKNSTGDDIKAIPWTLSKAVAYLLNFYKVSWALDGTSYNDVAMGIFNKFGDPEISNVNLEGKSLLHALQELLEPHNYGMYCDPAANAQGKHRIRFFYRGSGNQVTVRLEPRGTQSSSSTSNLIAMSVTEDTTSAVNHIEAYGDRISFTTLAHTDPPDATVPTLVQGWKDADLVYAYEADGVTVNPFDKTFRQNYCDPNLITSIHGHYPYGVGRYWCVNLGEQPSEDLEDLSTDFSGDNSIDPRRFEKPDYFNQNNVGGELAQSDVTVEMSFDNGHNWDIVEKGWYRIASDSLGLVFPDPALERLGIKFKNNDVASGKSYWQALSDQKLQIRILCSIKSDERVSTVRNNAGVTCPLATNAVYNNAGFKKVVYNSNASSAVYYTKFSPLQVTQDDTDALELATNTLATNTDRLMISGEMQVLLGNFGDFKPGQIVTQIAGRNINFSPPPTILRVVTDFQNQHVHLTLDNRKVKSVIRAKPVLNQDRREHKLGIEHPTTMQGGNQVPYIPGDQKSYLDYLRNGGGQ